MKKEKINYFIVEIELYSTDLLVVVGDIEGAIKWLDNKTSARMTSSLSSLLAIPDRKVLPVC